MQIEIAKAIAMLTAEYDLPPFTDDRVEMWMGALSKFPAGSVKRSAESYVLSSKYRPQLADIVNGCIAQLAGGWLGADEAWALMPKSESESAMLTEEIAQAMAAAAPLLEVGDRVAARMAFRDAYTRLTDLAKIEGRLPVFFPSFGTDASGRVTVLANAVRAGQINLERATEALPEYARDILRMCDVKEHPLLAGPTDAQRAKAKALLLTLKVGA